MNVGECLKVLPQTTSNLASLAPNMLKTHVFQISISSHLSVVNFTHLAFFFFLQIFTFCSALFLVSQILTFCAVVRGAHRPRITNNNRNNEPGNNETC